MRAQPLAHNRASQVRQPHSCTHVQLPELTPPPPQTESTSTAATKYHHIANAVGNLFPPSPNSTPTSWSRPRPSARPNRGTLPKASAPSKSSNCARARRHPVHKQTKTAGARSIVFSSRHRRTHHHLHTSSPSRITALEVSAPTLGTCSNTRRSCDGRYRGWCARVSSSRLAWRFSLWNRRWWRVYRG